MQKFLNRIQQQQKDMDYCDFTEEEKWEYFRSIALALNLELAEVMNEVPWKPWKPIYNQQYKPDRAAAEICDVFVFAYVLWNTLNPEDLGIEEAMNQTMEKIENRIKLTNYGKQEKTK